MVINLAKVKARFMQKGTEISVISTVNKDDFISLTDMAKHRNPDEPNIVVANW